MSEELCLDRKLGYRSRAFNVWRRFDSGGAEEVEDFLERSLERSFSFMPTFRGRCDDDDDDIEVRCVIINIIIRTFAYNITNLASFIKRHVTGMLKGEF